MPTAPTTAIPWAPLPGKKVPDGDDWDEWYATYQENIERYDDQLHDLTEMIDRAKKVAKLREEEVKRQRQELIELQREVKQLNARADSLEKKQEENDEDFEEKAIQYVYEHTGQYDDWVKGSTLYQKLQEENKKLQEENKKKNK